MLKDTNLRNFQMAVSNVQRQYGTPTNTSNSKFRLDEVKRETSSITHMHICNGGKITS